MTLSVREALETTALKYGKLLAGEGGLDNTIKWVTVVEVLEDTKRLAEGELLVATGYGLEREEEKRARFIPSLAERKLAGVAVLTGFYLPEITRELVEQADKYNLPLIELPGFLNFSDITRSILQKIVHSQYELLDFSENIHQELLQLVLSNKSFPSIAELLAARTGGDILIYDANWELVARYGMGHISGERQKEILVSFKSGELTAALKRGEVVCFESLYDAVPMTNIAAPVTAENKNYGYIVLIKPHKYFSELDRISIGHAAMVCALEFLKFKAIKETEWRMQGDFLDEILAGKWVKASMITERGRLMGFDFSNLHNVCIIKLCITPTISNEARVKEHLYCLYEIAKKAFGDYHIKVFAKLRHDSLVLVLEGETLSREEILLATERIKERWASSAPNIRIMIGVGDNRRSIEQLPKCAEEAELVLKFGHFLKLRNQVCFYGDLGIFHWLIELYEQKVDLRVMCDNALGNLLEYDRKHGKKLMQTLETYLALNQNIQQTASALFVHRHTLKYRLSRIEAITGMCLNNPDHRIQLQLAIYIHKFLSTL
ncbi:MAG: PucR family transcriptional regulator ligand-binding domain-containing protein [Peptococcaceae bacterium]|nr:PucR family transcriptional regulator ligand-binding domain-containing protein [Peptococcaceae bacterium]